MLPLYLQEFPFLCSQSYRSVLSCIATLIKVEHMKAGKHQGSGSMGYTCPVPPLFWTFAGVQLKLDRPWSQPAYLFLHNPTSWKRSKALLLSYRLLLRIISKLSLISTPVEITVHRSPLPPSFLCSFYRWSTYRSSLQPPWGQFVYYSHSLSDQEVFIDLIFLTLVECLHTPN